MSVWVGFEDCRSAAHYHRLSLQYLIGYRSLLPSLLSLRAWGSWHIYLILADWVWPPVSLVRAEKYITDLRDYSDTAYRAAHLLVGRDLVCLLLELASWPSQLADIPTAKARLATYGVFSEKSLPTRRWAATVQWQSGYCDTLGRSQIIYYYRFFLTLTLLAHLGC